MWEKEEEKNAVAEKIFRKDATGQQNVRNKIRKTGKLNKVNQKCHKIEN